MNELTIVLRETEGALARIAQTLGDANINIIDIDADEVDQIGVVHVKVEQTDFEAAHHALRETGHQVMPMQVLLVNLEDKPGALAKLAVMLSERKVNVRSMRIVRREDGYCLAAIVPEPIEMARAILADQLVGS